MLKKYIPLIIILLIADQVLKIWVKTHMVIGEQFSVMGNWFYISFIENSGIAYGYEISHPMWKPGLTIFRIVAVIFIFWYIARLVKRKLPTGFIVCAVLIFSGATGNVIDSIFYGKLFSESYSNIATFLPESGGYAPFLYGKVVDMFYFPLIEIDKMPDFIPFWGGKPFVFFSPIFNLADSYITVGISIVLLFYRKSLQRI